MSRGSGAGRALAPAPRHPYRAHHWKPSEVPGVCSSCPLPRGNAVHDEQALATEEADRDAAQAEHQRRTGDW